MTYDTVCPRDVFPPLNEVEQRALVTAREMPPFSTNYPGYTPENKTACINRSNVPHPQHFHQQQQLTPPETPPDYVSTEPCGCCPVYQFLPKNYLGERYIPPKQPVQEQRVLKNAESGESSESVYHYLYLPYVDDFVHERMSPSNGRYDPMLAVPTTRLLCDFQTTYLRKPYHDQFRRAL